MCSGSWWDEFTCRLGTAEWAANTGAPLAITLLGFAVAVWLVRRQLRSDRALRRAERTTRITDPVAAHMIAAGKRLEETRGGEVRASFTWAEALPLDEVCREVDVPGLMDVIERPLSIWADSHFLTKEHARGDQDQELADFAAAQCVAAAGADLVAAGRKLRDWDGLPPVPFEHDLDPDRYYEGRSLLSEQTKAHFVKEMNWRRQALDPNADHPFD